MNTALLIAAVVLLAIDVITHVTVIILVVRYLRPCNGWIRTIKDGIEHKKQYYA